MRIFLLWCLYDWSLQVYDKHSATLSIKIFQWGSLRKYFTFFFIDSVRLVGTNLSSPPHSFSTLFIATFKEIIFNASYLGLFNVSFSIPTRKRKLSRFCSSFTLLPELRPLETACWWMWRAASRSASSYFSSGANLSCTTSLQHWKKKIFLYCTQIFYL